tara:strand:- start:5220 stop:5453 length:234 start_codon:yes stop_codon:yes gene_type:complete
MTEQEIYFAEQEFNRFEMIMNTKEYLTKEEYDFCVAYDDAAKTETTYVGLDKDRLYLNLNVYSEHNHDKRQYELETS